MQMEVDIEHYPLLRSCRGRDIDRRTRGCAKRQQQYVEQRLANGKFAVQG